MKKAVTILLSIIMVLNIFTVNTFANSLYRPNINVDGNNVTIQLKPKKNTTIVITDESGNRKYIDQSDLGNFKINLNKGKYKAYITDCETENFTIYNDVQVNGEEVVITGNTDKNTFVTIEVKDLKGNRKHIDQTTSDNNGEYKFNFSLKLNEKYIAYIRSSAENEEVHKINFETINSIGKESLCKLLPKPGSKNNEYNTEFSMEFTKEVKIVSSQNPQVTLKAEKIPGTPKGEAEDKYEKKFKNVLKVDHKNNKKVIIDLTNEGDRLDVDYKYTVEINKNVIVEKETNNPINLLKDLKWDFDTLWKENNSIDGLWIKDNIIGFNTFYNLSKFDGIYVNDVCNVCSDSCKVIYTKKGPWNATVKNYPIKWESLDSDIVTVDRNGKIFGKSAGNGRIKISVPQSKREHGTEKYITVEVRPHVNRKLQEVNTYEAKSLGNFAVSENGNIYINGMGKILCLNPNLTINNKFQYKGCYCERLKNIYKINNREYIITSIEKENGKKIPYYEYKLIDIETGKIYKKFKTPELDNIFLQYEENSSLFLMQIDGGEIDLYDVEKDKVLWRYNYSNSMPSAVTYQGGIYIAYDKYIAKLDKSGREIWKYTCNSNTDQVYNINIDKEGNIYTRLSLNNYGGYTILCLNSSGKFKWISNKYSHISQMLYAERDGALFTVEEGFENKNNQPGRFRLIKLSSKDGKIINEYTYPINNKTTIINWEDKFLGEYSENGETLLYTPKVVFDKNRNIIAYTDIPYSRDMIFKNGYLYKLKENRNYMEPNGKNVLQKVKLGGEYTPKPTLIDAEDINIYENSECNIVAKVLDQCGFKFSGCLNYEIKDNSGLLTVTKDGKLKAGDLEYLPKGKYSKEITVNIKYNDGNVNLFKDIKVKVKQTPIPVKIYAYASEKLGENPVENLVTDTSGTRRPVFCVFVQDQHGEFMKDKIIKYEVGDKDIVVPALYPGLGGKYECKYECVIGGEKAGKSTITAYLEENPKIRCTVNVTVQDTIYDLLWRIGTNGPWGNKRCYHVEGILNDFIYCNENHITAVNKKNGKELWKSDVGVYYGMEISHPYIDENGIVYVYDRSNTAVAAIDSKNKGQKLWGKFYSTEPIYQMDVTDNYIYLMTKKGTMYKLDKKGNEIWRKKISDKNTKNMQVYSDDISYVVSKENVYKVYGDGKYELFYKGNGFINIRDIGKSGNVLLENSSDLTNYKAICLNNDGTKLWEKNIDAEFTAKWDKNKVYIVSYRPNTFNFKLYAYDEKGQELFKPVTHKTSPIETHYSYFAKERKPIIKNGTVYTYIEKTCGFDAFTGKFKWETYICDMYTPSPPATLSVDDNNIIYSSSGAGGMFAYKIKENCDSKGFNITLNGTRQLKLNSLNEVQLSVTNNTKEIKKDVVILAELRDKNSNKSLSAWAIKKNFNKKDSKEYSFGVNVPKAGEYKLVIKAMQGEKVLDKVEF